MFRFTIRDVLWLMVVVALGLGWWLSYSGQNATIQTLKTVSDVEGREIFPSGWEGLTAALRNERAILQFRVLALKYELEKRGHSVIIDQDQVVVDPPATGHRR